MHYSESTTYRPPQEASSVLLQVMSGCSHRGCAFCGMYRDVAFRISPQAEVESDLQELSTFGDRIKRIFLLNGDALCLGEGQLDWLFERLGHYLPALETVASYARVATVLRHSEAALARWHAAGLNDLYLGLESGDDDVLARMEKGQTVADAIAACAKLDAVGIRYRALFVNGLSGAGHGVEAGRKAAALVNAIHADLVWAGSLTILPQAPIAQWVADGRFVEPTEKERLDEYAALIAHIETPVYFTSQHPTVLRPVAGELPAARDRLLGELARFSAAMDEGAARRRREALAKDGRM